MLAEIGSTTAGFARSWNKIRTSLAENGHYILYRFHVFSFEHSIGTYDVAQRQHTKQINVDTSEDVKRNDLSDDTIGAFASAPYE